MLWILCACTPKSDTGWTAPTFSGDGLPTSVDSEHSDPRRDGETGGNSGETGDTAGSEFPDFDLVDGFFAYQNYYGYLFGYIQLVSEAVSCHDGLTTYVDGVVYYVLPAADENGDPAWAATYESCGSQPCIYYAYWTEGADYGFLTGSVSIDTYDAHYVTVTYENEIDADTLTFYNCGDVGDWGY